MNNFVVEIIGYLGSFLISIILIPQVIKTFTTKETKGLSYIFLLIGFFASVLMVVYGFFINALPIVIANIIYMICNISLLIMKYNYDKLNNIDN